MTNERGTDDKKYQSHFYYISTGLATKNEFPFYTDAIVIGESEKAVKMYGKMAKCPKQICSYCGRKLTTSEEMDRRLCKRHLDLNFQKFHTCWLPKRAVVLDEVFSVGNYTVDVLPEDIKEAILKKQKRFNDFRQDKYVTFSHHDNPSVINILFPYDALIVNAVRNLEYRVWDASHKIWQAKSTYKNLQILENLDFTFSKSVLEYYNELKSKDPKGKYKIATPKIQRTRYPLRIPDDVKLYPYQEEGVQFICQNMGKAILADEPGLGKTAQAITFLGTYGEKAFPAVVVCPATLKENWKKEIQKFLINQKEVHIEILESKKPWELSREDFPAVYIINYDILEDWVEELKRVRPQTLIVDECHYICSTSAKRTKAVIRLAKGIPFAIPISGTPAVNRPIELFVAIRLINPKLFPSYYSYAHRYCGPKYNGFGWSFNGATHMDELHAILKSIMIRRKKEDVLQDLPDKQYSYVPFKLSTKSDYWWAEEQFLAWVAATKGEDKVRKALHAQQLAKLTALRKLSVMEALDDSLDWIQNFLDSSDEKLVVFAIHKDVISAIEKRFSKISVKIDGSVPVNKRDAIKDRFQNDKNVRLFIGNIKAAGVGITLTAASNVALLELPWTPGDFDQAVDRLHRISQKNAVTVYLLLAEGTVEERLAKLIDEKRKMLSQVLDGKDVEESNMISALISKLEEAE